MFRKHDPPPPPRNPEELSYLSYTGDSFTFFIEPPDDPNVEAYASLTCPDGSLIPLTDDIVVKDPIPATPKQSAVPARWQVRTPAFEQLGTHELNFSGTVARITVEPMRQKTLLIREARRNG